MDRSAYENEISDAMKMLKVASDLAGAMIRLGVFCAFYAYLSNQAQHMSHVGLNEMRSLNYVWLFVGLIILVLAISFGRLLHAFLMYQLTFLLPSHYLAFNIDDKTNWKRIAFFSVMAAISVGTSIVLIRFVYGVAEQVPEFLSK